MKKQNFKKLATLSVLSTAFVAGVMIFGGDNASAHGYVEKPASRAYTVNLLKEEMGWDVAHAKFGNAIDTPNGVEGIEGFPFAGPEDGHIASANGVLGDYKLDQQTPDFWVKNEMTGGENAFTWHYTATHPTRKWDYFITKKDWDPSKPITRNDLELIHTEEHDGSLSENKPTHFVDVPNDRAGYHVILAVWEVADTDKSFYQAIDVNLTPDDNADDKEAPTKVQNLNQTGATIDSITFSFDAATDNKGIKEYKIFRDGEEVATTSNTSYTDKELQSDSAYKYTVQAVDFAGNKSEMSDKLVANTLEMPEEDTEAPTAPGHLHSMEVSSDSASLMWGASSDNVGVKEYAIYRDGEKIDTTTETSYEDTGLDENTTYNYYVVAIDESGNESEKSNELEVTTEEADEPISGREWELGSFTNPTSYETGETIVHNGKEYVVLQGHLNYGDITWAPDAAPSLFQLK